jgi:hypothetical protein
MVTNLTAMGRVLYGHDWQSCEEWAAAIHQLAELDDDQILQMTRDGERRLHPMRD